MGHSRALGLRARFRAIAPRFQANAVAGPMDVSPPAIWTVPIWRAHRLAVLVYALVDVPPSPAGPLGDSIDVFVRREDAERFVEEIRGDALATFLRIEERELEAGGETS